VQRSFVNSGHAFVCFDSVGSLNIILKHFEQTPWRKFKIFILGIKIKIQNFKDWWAGKKTNKYRILVPST